MFLTILDKIKDFTLFSKSTKKSSIKEICLFLRMQCYENNRTRLIYFKLMMQELF